MGLTVCEIDVHIDIKNIPPLTTRQLTTSYSSNELCIKRYVCVTNRRRGVLVAMSARRNKTNQADKEVAKLRSELEELKAQARAADASDIATQNVHSHEFDQLSPTEQSAASLGVSPTAWKPISFLNNAHYQQLIKAI